MQAPILKLLAAAPVETAAGDAELLARFVGTRDEDAFAALVRRHGPLVYRVCRRLAGQEWADDAFQAAFIVFSCRARRLRNPGSVGSWLVAVAGRIARRLRSREARRATWELPNTADRSYTSDSRLLADELAELLDRELIRLPDTLRDAVVLCLLQGHTQDEAAAELGGSVRTIRRRLARAKSMLRRRLERKGIVPAVAAGLVSGGMAGAMTVPPELIHATVEGVRGFIDGVSPRGAPAHIAKAVVANMVTTNYRLVAAFAAIIGLGLVWAVSAQSESQQGAATSASHFAEPPSTRVPGPDGKAKLLHESLPASQRSPNFIVHAPTAVAARVVAGEAEYQREQIAKLWLGKALPNWSKPATILVTFGWASGVGSTTLTFAEATASSRVREIEIRLDGFTLESLEGSLPREVAQTILATHFGKTLPQWVSGGIARLHEPPPEQAGYDSLTRQLLKEGRGLRLKSLFRMTEYPKDVTLFNAQSHSVSRFLLAAGHSRTMLLEFIGRGMGENSAESWDAAAKMLGYKSVDVLEGAWLEWLKKSESRFKLDATPSEKPPEDGTDRIPPVKLPARESPLARP